MKFLKQNKIFNFRAAFFPKLSLKNRLWLFQIVIVLLILVCILTIAQSSGVIADLSENPYHSVNNQLRICEGKLSKKCLLMMNSTVELAKKLDKSIQKQLSAAGTGTSGLNDNPELLRRILNSEVEKACFAMEKARVTGVFVFLDATVNSSLKNSANSKAGFFIVNMNPDPMPSESRQLFLLYGPVQLARDNEMYLHPQWELELDLSLSTFKRRTDIFKKPFEAALANKGEDIYNLGYWNPLFIPADNADSVMSFSVPLIDKNGEPYGVCGMEISKTALESVLMSEYPEFDRQVLLFSKQMGIGIDVKNALTSGINTSWLYNGSSEYLYTSQAPEQSEKLNRYYFDSPDEDGTLGLNIDVRLYPAKSVFSDEKWTLAMLLPKSDVIAKTTRLYYIITGLALLFIASIFITLFTSKYCISPLLDAINKIKENETEVKTNVIEIDNLIESLLGYHNEFNNEGTTAAGLISTTSEAGQEHSAQSLQLDEEQYRQFHERLSALSNAERKIFDLYMQGYDAKEICSMLFISINTLKTHNRRIYAKMNVCSRAELVKYYSELIGKV